MFLVLKSKNSRVDNFNLGNTLDQVNIHPKS